MKLNSRRQKAKATLTEKVPNEETPIDRKEHTPSDLVHFAGIIQKLLLELHYLAVQSTNTEAKFWSLILFNDNVIKKKSVEPRERFSLLQSRCSYTWWTELCFRHPSIYWSDFHYLQWQQTLSDMVNIQKVSFPRLIPPCHAERQHLNQGLIWIKALSNTYPASFHP